VINVAILSVIRRWRLRDLMTIRAIARRTGLSRNTIRKYLTSDVIDPRYPSSASACAMPWSLSDFRVVTRASGTILKSTCYMGSYG
jgi:predicted transcriptional regulator